MSIEPIVFFDLVIAIVVLATALGVFVVSYVNTLEKFKMLQKKQSDIESEAHRKAVVILQEARNKAIKIIEDTNVSQDLLKKTFEEELKAAAPNWAKKLQTVSEEFLKVYQKTLTDLKDNNIKIITNISKDIESSTKAELEDFKEILRKETFSSQKIVEGKIEQDYQIVEKELEAYRTEKLKKIEDQIYNIIQNVSKEVLGKTLTLQEHEQLVIDALEKAKKEGTNF
jgi:dGTP triphosphohydrolase